MYVGGFGTIFGILYIVDDGTLLLSLFSVKIVRLSVPNLFLAFQIPPRWPTQL